MPYPAIKLGQKETTFLTPDEEQLFRKWTTKNQITDVDNPESYYDYRGFWKDQGGPNIKFGVDHFPDTFKQHGHPTFSQESKYSTGYSDGGMWIPDSETLLKQPKMAVSHKRNYGKR